MNEQCKEMTPEEARRYAEEDRKRMALISAAPEMLSEIENLLYELRQHFPTIAEPAETASGLKAAYLCAETIVQKARGGQ